ncbi:MAG: DUF262 domain-containing protein [Paludibacteraceae bacterium]|nr:DUF262 domain-containing protein [Paludibacteraceae bacterium]
MNELYTFERILTKGIERTEGDNTTISSILIPRIQRSYAQGRKNEAVVRESFLKEIFASLVNDTELELNFVYGSLEESEEGAKFLLLDGQQRLTTLFLLYWYIANAEKDSIPEFISHFRYETRTTSTDFIQDLTRKKVSLSNTPSVDIRKAKWFTLSYDSDPTISAMLVMLDAIHSKYAACDNHRLYDRLENIKFYVLLLENFGLSEELYIKMNARGLPLTPYENFKADLVKFMLSNEDEDFMIEVEHENPVTKEKGLLQYYLLFSTKLDTKWTDVFWNKRMSNMKEFSRRFFCFFMRYFANKYYLSFRKDIPGATVSKEPIFKFLNEKSEEQTDRYLGFECYDTILKQEPELIYSIEKVLDLLQQHYEKDIMPLLVPVWNTSESPFDLFEAKPTRYHKMIFAAITEYLEACETFDIGNFKKWIRVLWNIVENIDFNTDADQIAHARKLSEIIKTPGATIDVYGVLAKYVGDNLKCISEEAIKAREIVNYPAEEWEAAFIEAESHKFFAGMVNFFFEPNKGVGVFKHRFQIMKDIFDENGINKRFAKEHILLRTMLGQFDDFDTLNHYILVESDLNADDKTILKNELSNHKCLHDLFCELGDLEDVDKVSQYLADELTDEYEITWRNKPKGGYDDDRLNKAYNLLVKDPRLLDFAFDEKHHYGKSLVIRELYGGIVINRDHSSVGRIYIDTDWSNIITGFYKNGEFEYIDPQQFEFYKNYRHYNGYSVVLYKKYDDFRIDIVFGFKKSIDVYVLCPSKEKTKKLINELKGQLCEDGKWIIYKSLNYTPFSEDYKYIYKQIDIEVEEIEEWIDNQ